jgi:hypothetical protein
LIKKSCKGELDQSDSNCGFQELEIRHAEGSYQLVGRWNTKNIYSKCSSKSSSGASYIYKIKECNLQPLAIALSREGSGSKRERVEAIKPMYNASLLYIVMMNPPCTMNTS